MPDADWRKRTHQKTNRFVCLPLKRQRQQHKPAQKTHLKQRSAGPERLVKWSNEGSPYIPSDERPPRCLMSVCLPAPGTSIFVPLVHQWRCSNRIRPRPFFCLQASPHPNLSLCKSKASPPPQKTFQIAQKPQSWWWLRAEICAAHLGPNSVHKYNPAGQ